MAKQTLLITLYISELKYDIQNGTYLTSRSRRNEKEGNDEEASHVIANDDDENKNHILRSISSAFSELKNKMSEYLSESAVLASNDALISESDNLTLSLSMPSNYNLATKDAITSAAHDYIVNTAIGKWFIITDKADAKEYFDLASNNLTIITQAISKRVRPTRPEIS